MQSQISHSSANFPILGSSTRFNNIGFCVSLAFDWMLTDAGYLQGIDYNQLNFAARNAPLNRARIVFHTIMGNILMAKTGLQSIKPTSNSMEDFLANELKDGQTVAVKVFCTVPQYDDKQLCYHMLGLKKISGNTYELLDGNRDQLQTITTDQPGDLYRAIISYWQRENPQWPIKDFALYTLRHERLQDADSIDNIPKITNKYISKLRTINNYAATTHHTQPGLSPTYAIALYEAFKCLIKRGHAATHGGEQVSIKALYYGGADQVPAKEQETLAQKYARWMAFSRSFNLILQEISYPYRSISGFNTQLEGQQVDEAQYMYKKTLLHIRPLNELTAKWSLAQGFFQDIEDNVDDVIAQIRQHGYTTAIMARYRAIEPRIISPVQVYASPFSILSIALLVTAGIQAVFLSATAICAPEWLLNSVLKPMANSVGSHFRAIATYSASSLGLVILAAAIGAVMDRQHKHSHTVQHPYAHYTYGASMGIGIGHAIMTASICLAYTISPHPELLLASFKEAMIEGVGNLTDAVRMLGAANLLGLGLCAGIGAVAAHLAAS